MAKNFARATKIQPLRGSKLKVYKEVKMEKLFFGWIFGRG